MENKSFRMSDFTGTPAFTNPQQAKPRPSVRLTGPMQSVMQEFEDGAPESLRDRLIVKQLLTNRVLYLMGRYDILEPTMLMMLLDVAASIGATADESVMPAAAFADFGPVLADTVKQRRASGVIALVRLAIYLVRACKLKSPNFPDDQLELSPFALAQLNEIVNAGRGIKTPKAD